jgi:hypothetical protein
MDEWMDEWMDVCQHIWTDQDQLTPVINWGVTQIFLIRKWPY